MARARPWEPELAMKTRQPATVSRLSAATSRISSSSSMIRMLWDKGGILWNHCSTWRCTLSMVEWEVNGGRWRIRQGWLSGSRAWFTIGEPVKAEGKPPAINDGSRRIELRGQLHRLTFFEGPSGALIEKAARGFRPPFRQTLWRLN